MFAKGQVKSAADGCLGGQLWVVKHCIYFGANGSGDVAPPAASSASLSAPVTQDHTHVR